MEILSNIPIVAAIGVFTIALVAVFSVFAYTRFKKYNRRHQFLKTFILHPSCIQEVKSQNWIWPELLQQTKTSAADLLREFRETNNYNNTNTNNNNSNSDTSDSNARENGPRAADSAAQYVMIKPNVPHISGKFIAQKFKLKSPMALIQNQRSSSQNLSSQVISKNKNQVADEEMQRFSIQIKFKRNRDKLLFAKLRELKHENVLAMLHVSFDKDNTMRVLYQIAGKNTLSDVLMSRRFELNTKIQQSLVKDLINGMYYLYRKTIFKFHGNLNPRNLFIDDYWTLKIGGFGFLEYTESCHPIFNDQYDSRVFVAPELLHVYPHQSEGTHKGDIYSIAMLIYAIFTGQYPFHEHMKRDSIIKVLKRITHDSKSETRPQLPASIPINCQETIKLCWQYDPSERLDIMELLQASHEWDEFEDTSILKAYDLTKRVTRKERSAVDLARYAFELEQYIRNIEAAYTNQSIQILTHSMTNVEKESIMSKKAKELSSQLSDLQEMHDNELRLKDDAIQNLKKKFEADLTQLEKQMMSIKYSMLPPPIVQMMMDTSSKRLALDTLLTKVGANVVDLERNIRFYENATVMFVSIHGFNDLINQLLNSPHLLLELLNQYYYALEKIISEYQKVYLVERICDTCIIISGAPDKNPKHLETCAVVAIKIKEWFKTWDFSWVLGSSEEKLAVKIGIHTGSILGGVIGNIPRFLTMSAQEIRMSAISQSILTNSIRFKFENRGQIDLGPSIGKIWVFALLD